MKKTILFIFCIIISYQYGNAFFTGNYLDISLEESKNKLFISASTIEGDIKIAYSILDSTDKNSLDFHLYKGLLNYSLYGKSFLEKYCDTIISDGIEEKDLLYARMWWSNIIGNWEDYKSHSNEYKTQFGENFYDFKIKTLKFIDENKFSDPEDISTELKVKYDKINHLLNSGKLSRNDSLSALLLFCELSDFELVQELSRTKKLAIFNKLKFIQEYFPDEIDIHTLILKLEELELKEASAFIIEISNKYNDGSIQKLFNYLNSLDEKDKIIPFKVKEIEANVSSIINNETDFQIKERMKALLKFMTYEHDINEYGMFGPDGNGINYSKEFQTAMNSKLSLSQITQLLKELITQGSNSLTDERDQKEKIENLEQLLDNDEWKKISIEDASLVLGFAEYSVLFVDDWMKYPIFKTDGKKTLDVYKINSLNNYTKFISENPLFYRNYKFLNFPETNATEINQALLALDNLFKLYPGNIAILKNKLAILNDFDEIIEKNKQKYFPEIFNTTIKLFEINQNEGSGFSNETEIDNYFNYNGEDMWESNLKGMIDACNENDKKVILQLLSETINKYPKQYNINLLYLKLLLENNDYEEYLNQFLNIMAFHPDAELELVEMALHEINLSKLRSYLENFNEIKIEDNVNLKSSVEVPILLELEDADGASQVMAEIIAETDPNEYIYYYYNTLLDFFVEDELVLAFKNILELNTEKDVCYYYLATAQLLNNDEEGMKKTLESLRTQNPTKLKEQIEDFAFFLYEDPKFNDELNFNPIINELVKNHPEMKAIFK